MDKKTLETAFGAQLGVHGFKKKASSWYRPGEEVLQMVNLQRSLYGCQYYVNLCFVPVGMDVEGMPTPKMHKCPIQIRLTEAFPEQKVEIESVFDLESSRISEAERKERIVGFTHELILPFLDCMMGLSALRHAIGQREFKGASINLAARRHLGVLGPSSPQ